MHCTSHLYDMTSFAVCCMLDTVFLCSEGEGWEHGSHGKWVYNQHLQTATLQTKEWETDSLGLYLPRSEFGGMTRFALTQWICPEVSVADSYGFIKLWVYQMRNCTTNSTCSNKKPFSCLINLNPALWLRSSNDPPAQVKACANDFRLQEKFLIPRVLIYPAWLLIGTCGLF